MSVYTTCPRCGHEAETDQALTTHMRAEHPEVFAKQPVPAGSPSVQGARKDGALWVIAAIVVVGVVGGTIIGLRDHGDRPSYGDRYGAQVQCEDYLNDQLKSPRSAHYTVERASHDGQRWVLAGTVDADNSFGASIRNGWVCTVTHIDGDTYSGAAQLLE